MNPRRGRASRIAQRPLRLVAACTVLVALAVSWPGTVSAAAGTASQSFTASGEQTFTVPAGVTSLQVVLVGGRGGVGDYGAPGGISATVTGTLAVTPGATLYAEVAGNGVAGTSASVSSTGGSGGGGAGGYTPPLFVAAPPGGGGGGASDLRTCSASAPGGCGGLSSLASRLIVAAGGGGGGGAGDGPDAGTVAGGNGGSADQPGSAGQTDTEHDTPGGPGLQGTPSGGGAAGSGAAPTGGTLGLGGAGGAGLSGAGGGGGGIYGGGGGGAGADTDIPGSNPPVVYDAGSGGGGGGASGVPSGAAGVSGFSLVPTAAGAQPSITLTWTLPPPAATTSAVTNVAATTATVNGSVNPNGAQLTGCEFQVSPAPPSGGSFPCAQQVPVGSSPVPVSATVAGLSPATSYTVTFVATNAQGAADGAAVTFQTAAVATGAGTETGTTTTTTTSAPSPVLSSLTLTQSRFRPGERAPKLGSAGKIGTTISFRLSRTATVTLRFARLSPGRRFRGRCVTATAARRRDPRCTRSISVAGEVTITAPAGLDKLAFDGVLSHGGRLTPAAYRLSVVARSATGQTSAAKRAAFTLL